MEKQNTWINRAHNSVCMILIFASCKIPREILFIKGMSNFKLLATSCQSFIQKAQKGWVFAPQAVGDEPHDQPRKRVFLEEYFHRNLECGVARECAIIKLKNLNFFPCFPPCTNSSSRGREGKELWKMSKVIWMYHSYENLSVRYENLLKVSGQFIPHWHTRKNLKCRDMTNQLKNEKQNKTKPQAERAMYPDLPSKWVSSLIIDFIQDATLPPFLRILLPLGPWTLAPSKYGCTLEMPIN